jgi:hypothetical protein
MCLCVLPVVDAMLTRWPQSKSTDNIMRDVIDSPAFSDLMEAVSREGPDVRVLPVAVAVDPFQCKKDDAKYSSCPFLVVGHSGRAVKLKGVCIEAAPIAIALETSERVPLAFLLGSVDSPSRSPLAEWAVRSAGHYARDA